MNCYKMRELSPQYVNNEDIGIPPMYSTPSKKKKNGGADPRFRRVISTEYRSDNDVETEKSVQEEERTTEDKVVSFLKIPNDSSFFTTPSLKKIEEPNRQDFSSEVTKDTGFQDSENIFRECRVTGYPTEKTSDVKTYKDSDKVRNNSVTTLKRSASDCTLTKKKSVLEENDEEVCDKVRAYPSATRISKIHNWMKDYNIYPEKRRSVITVIGQTQTKPFSKILSEINQRRKLAKELDRHALCEAIMESSETQPHVKNLVAKVDFVLPDGKIIYSTEKVYLRRDNKFTDAGVYTHQSLEALDVGDQKKKVFQMIPERDSSVSQFGRKSRTKRSTKKIVTPFKEKLKVKGNLRSFCASLSSVFVWLFLVVLCLSFCFSLFILTAKHPHTYFVIDYFKPKTTAWYEKLLF